MSIRSDEEGKVNIERLTNIHQIQLTTIEQQQIINNIIMSDSDAEFRSPEARQIVRRLQASLDS
jgi:hypothetical protein